MYVLTPKGQCQSLPSGHVTRAPLGHLAERAPLRGGGQILPPA